MFNTNHFDSYCNYICNNKDFKDILVTEEDYLDAIKEYCNNFSSFLLIKKKDINDIKKYRKDIIIDYYISTYKIDNKDELNNYYLTNIKDNYNTNYNPSRSYEYCCNDFIIDNINDDVKDHYDFINKKFEYYGNKSMTNKNTIEDNIDYAFDDGDTISIVSSYDDYYEEYDEYDDYEEYYDENEEYYSDDYDY
jgi:hypothetical protein